MTNKGIPPEVPIAVSAIRRQLRFMMCESPPQAEQHLVDLSAMRKIDLEDLGAYEFVSDGQTSYIVYDRGTKYTTTVRPTHVPSEKIVRVNTPSTSNELWLRLQESCRALNNLSSDVFSMYRLGNSLDAIGYFYSPAAKGPKTRHIDALGSLGYFSELSGDGNIKKWGRECSNRLVECYGWYLLAGNEVVQPLATLLLFDFCPFPLDTVLEMNRDFLRFGMGGASTEIKITMPFPVVDIKFYLEHPAVPPNVAVVWGTGIAREFQHKAEELRDRAKTRYTIEEFQVGLYLSLLYYRCALYAYTVTQSLSKAKLATSERALSRLEEAGIEAALCEEYRVIIGASLAAALEGVSSGILLMPSIARVREIQNWIEWMARPSSAVDAEFEIRQAYDAELIMPAFLRDLALGYIACVKGQTTKGLQKMLTVVKELEKHVRDAAALGDPNYLSSTYEIMSQCCANSGMEPESLEYKRRAEPAYYRAILA